MAQNQTQLSPMQMQQQNILARNAVVSNSVLMTQQIYSQAIDVSAQQVVSIGQGAIRNAGLLLGFIVEVSGEVTNGATNGATITPYGVSNIVKQFRFDDFSSYTRIQTSGRHLSLLNSLRDGHAYAGAYDPQLPIGYGSGFNVIEGADSLAANATDDLRMMYYLPIAYSPTDLRGAMYMATVSAASNLQITLQDAPFTGSGNPVDKVYTGNANGAWTNNVQVTVYQVYLDQLPRTQQGQVILPSMDLSVAYDLKETTVSGMTVGQDYPIPYSNFRAYLSTIPIFDNGGTLNSGSDVNYWSLTSANFTNIFKVTPRIAALMARKSLMADPPPGAYIFESRSSPINTINYGNMELNINASTVNSDARCIVGYEAFAKIAQVSQASSLPGG